MRVEVALNMRERYVIGQALQIAAAVIRRRPSDLVEESNADDMEELSHRLFSVYRGIHKRVPEEFKTLADYRVWHKQLEMKVARMLEEAEDGEEDS